MRASLLGLLAASCFALGCGIGDASSLFGGGQPYGGAGGSGGASSGSHGAKASSSSASSTASSSASASSASASVGVASSSSASSSSSSSSSSSGTGGLSNVDCDGTMCSIEGANACCYDGTHTHSPPYGKCIQVNGQTMCATYSGNGGYETVIRCQLPEQCPGAVCCAHRVFVGSSGGAYYDHVSCETQCDWPDVTLCDLQNPGAVTCPVVHQMGGNFQTVCEQSQLLPAGYGVCGQPP